MPININKYIQPPVITPKPLAIIGNIVVKNDLYHVIYF